MIVFSFLISCAGLGAEPIPHPDRPDRLVEERNGFSVEYSPEQEEYAEEVFSRLKKWEEGLERLKSEWQRKPIETRPLGFEEMRERRDEILAAISRSIGLRKPTDLMQKTYDIFVDRYEQKAILKKNAGDSFWKMCFLKGAMVWDKSDLLDRLKRGEAIPRIRLDEDGETVDLDFDVNRYFRSSRYDELEEQIELRGVDSSVAYKYSFHSKGEEFSGRESSSASVHLGNANSDEDKPEVTDNENSDAMNQNSGRMLLPIVLDEKDFESSQRDIGNSVIKGVLASFLRIALSSPTRISGFHNAQSILLALHETAEVGLVENCIGSDDRRAACDGTADFVSWKVLRDLEGREFADGVLDIASKTRRYADYQSKVDLASWLAAELEDDSEIDGELQHARYAFSALAVFLIAAREGEDTIPKVWRRIRRKRRSEVNMVTVDRVYGRLAGASLIELFEEVQTRPLEELLAELE